VNPDLASVYASKTDDELLTLAVERRSLESEAQSALWAELHRRKLTSSGLRPRATPDDPPFTKQNPAFNTPAKIGAAWFLLALIGFGLVFATVAYKAHLLGTAVLTYVLVWGPIFAMIAWATHRTIRNGKPRSLTKRKL